MTPVLLAALAAFFFGVMTVLVRIVLARGGVAPAAGTLFTILPACLVTAVAAGVNGEWGLTSAWPFVLAGRKSSDLPSSKVDSLGLDSQEGMRNLDQMFSRPEEVAALISILADSKA